MATSTAPRTAGSVSRKWLTPQHGVWPMLLLPYVVGVVVAGPSWWQLPLLVAWLAGYLFSYHALVAVKARRFARARAQLVTYGTLTVIPGVALLLAFPSLLWFAPAYVLLLGVNATYASRRRERAVVNDLASVLLCVLVAPMAAVVAGVAVSAVAPATLLVLLYLVGTVPYVKTMIRERGERAYYVGSVAYHAAALAAAGWLALPMAVPFGWYLARAAWLPRVGLVPKRVGMIEILNCALLVVTVALWAPRW